MIVFSALSFKVCPTVGCWIDQHGLAAGENLTFGKEVDIWVTLVIWSSTSKPN